MSVKRYEVEGDDGYLDEREDGGMVRWEDYEESERKRRKVERSLRLLSFSYDEMEAARDAWREEAGALSRTVPDGHAEWCDKTPSVVCDCPAALDAKAGA